MLHTIERIPQTGDTPRLHQIKRLVSQANFVVLPKGRYAPLIRGFLYDAGILIAPSDKRRGWAFDANGGYIGEYIYMRDAAISDFITQVPGSVGFTGAHQIVETLQGRDDHISTGPVLMMEGARFVIATHKSKVHDISEKLQLGQKIHLCTEYPYVSKQLARQYGWNATFEWTKKGASEVVASVYPHIDGALCIVSTGATIHENNLAIVKDNLRKITIRPVWNGLSGQ